jgi:hypothetical protein
VVQSTGHRQPLRVVDDQKFRDLWNRK